MTEKSILSAQLSSKDKKIILSGLLLVAAAGWAYMFYMAWALIHKLYLHKMHLTTHVLGITIISKTVKK